MITKDSFEKRLRTQGIAPVVWKYDESQFMDKYVSSICEGGFNPLLEDMTNSLGLTDAYNCPTEFIPVLCDCYSLPYYSDIPDVYYRKLLQNISSLRARKGTTNCVHYLCRALTGLSIDIDPINTDPNTLEIYLKADTLSDVLNVDMSTKVIGTFIKDFIPFYIDTVTIESVVNEVTMEILLYRSSLMTYQEEVYLPRNYDI